MSKTKVFQIRIDDETSNKIQALSKSNDITASTLIRNLIDNAYRMNVELYPCPFCGTANPICRMESDGMHIMCFSCGADLKSFGLPVTELWNK